MRIETNTVLTVAALRALLVGADDNAQVEFVRTVAPKPKTTGECWCGCGGATKSKFVPGHDSKFHGLAKKVARGDEPMPTSFLHDDAEADFMKWHDAEVANPKAKPAKAAPKAAPVAKAAKPDEDLEAIIAEVGGDEPEADDFELDADSDEFKALIASVTMS